MDREGWQEDALSILECSFPAVASGWALETPTSCSVGSIVQGRSRRCERRVLTRGKPCQNGCKDENGERLHCFRSRYPNRPTLLNLVYLETTMVSFGPRNFGWRRSTRISIQTKDRAPTSRMKVHGRSWSRNPGTTSSTQEILRDRGHFLNGPLPIGRKGLLFVCLWHGALFCNSSSNDAGE